MSSKDLPDSVPAAVSGVAGRKPAEKSCMERKVRGDPWFKQTNVSACTKVTGGRACNQNSANCLLPVNTASEGQHSLPADNKKIIPHKGKTSQPVADLSCCKWTAVPDSDYWICLLWSDQREWSDARHG